MKALTISPLLILLFFAFSPSATQAQSKPSAATAKSFLDFYYQGQGKGVILADSAVCADVINAECVDPVDPSLLKKGSKYKVWMAFVVPEGDEVSSIYIQFSKDDEMKFTRDLSAKGSIRYRTWRNFNPSEAGIWEVKVMDNREVELEELGAMSLVVSE